MSRRLIPFVWVNVVALLVVALAAPAARAQSRDSLLAVYNTQTIHAQGNKYVKGSNQLAFGQLKNEFPPGLALDLYRKSSQSRAIGQVMTVVAVAALVGSAVLRKNERAGGIALLIVGIGLKLGNLNFRKKSNELVERALWERNKNVLFNTGP